MTDEKVDEWKKIINKNVEEYALLIVDNNADNNEAMILRVHNAQAPFKQLWNNLEFWRSTNHMGDFLDELPALAQKAINSIKKDGLE